MQLLKLQLIFKKRFHLIMIKKITLLSILISYLFLSFNTYANLLISPTRIQFEERQRVAKVIVINQSDETKTYRLEWQEKIAKAGGGYVNYTKEQINPTALSSMVRLSPSQVRLAPGERQIVKIALRKPKDLPSKEYRSHLLFKALPNEEESSDASFGIRLNMILSYSIPVILRENVIEPKVNISNVAVVKGEKADALNVSLERQGPFSSFGKLEVFYKEQGSSTERKIATLNDYSIYPEVERTNVNLSLFDGGKLPNKGEVRIIYTGLNEFKNIVFAEKSINISSLNLVN